jgi:hypothetical protein
MEEVEVQDHSKEEGVAVEEEAMMEGAEKVEEAEVEEETLPAEAEWKLEEVEVLLAEEEALKEGEEEASKEGEEVEADVDHRKEGEDGDSMVVVKEEVRLGPVEYRAFAVHSSFPSFSPCSTFDSHRNVWRRRWNWLHP